MSCNFYCVICLKYTPKYHLYGYRPLKSHIKWQINVDVKWCVALAAIYLCVHNISATRQGVLPIGFKINYFFN